MIPGSHFPIGVVSIKPTNSLEFFACEMLLPMRGDKYDKHVMTDGRWEE